MTTALNPRSMTVAANQTLNAPLHTVFPLLCPVREFDWIEDWKCDVISTRTGIAEQNCVFMTKRDYGHSAPKDEVWIVSRYEPDKAIEFVKFCADLYVIKYDIWLSPLAGDRTQAVWVQTHIPLSEEGSAELRSATQKDFQAMIKALEQKMNYFLKTGEKLVGT